MAFAADHRLIILAAFTYTSGLRAPAMSQAAAVIVSVCGIMALDRAASWTLVPGGLRLSMSRLSLILQQDKEQASDDPHEVDDFDCLRS